MNFKLLDIICVLGGIQGLYLAIALQTLTNKNKSANRTLSILLFAIAFFLFCRITYFRLTNPFLIKIAFSVNTIMFVIGPLIYTYVRQLTFKEFKKFNLPLHHYIPAALYFTLVVYVFFILQRSYEQMLPKLLLIQFIAITLNLSYLFKSHQLIKFYQKEEKNHLSYHQNVTSFLNAFIIILTLFIFIWLIALFNEIFKLNLSLNYKMILPALLVIIFIVSYYSLKQPDVFRIKLKTETKKTKKQPVSNNTLIQLQEELELLMNKEKIYLNKQLTLTNLSEKLTTSPNNISWLINSVYNCSFNEYINRYRIKDFIVKIENEEHKKHTVLALAFDAGFNSKSTFNKAFKAEINNTPTDYIKNLQLS